MVVCLICKNWKGHPGFCTDGYCQLLEKDTKSYYHCEEGTYKDDVLTPNLHRVGAKDVGTKYDTGKPRLAEMIQDFAPVMLLLCEVWEFGANKYNKSNWKLVDNGEDRYLNALYRHSLATVENEYDDESKLLHCAHMIFNCMAYAYFVLRRLNEDKKN